MTKTYDPCHHEDPPPELIDAAREKQKQQTEATDSERAKRRSSSSCSVRPKFPPNRFILEGLFCSLKICGCGSTLTRKGCIQPNCFHYTKGFPSCDYNIEAAAYTEDGALDMYFQPNVSDEPTAPE